MKNIFVPGLWSNACSVVSGEIRSHGIQVLDTTGLSSFESRIRTLFNAIDSSTKTIIAHSAGCAVVAKAVTQGLLPNIEQFVMLNSAPLPGIMFKPTDPTFLRMMRLRYAGAMMCGKSLLLTDEDMEYLLCINKIDKVRLKLIPENGRFIREQIVDQYKWFERIKSEVFADRNVLVINAMDDRIISSTGKKTEMIYDGTCVRIEGGHMKTLTDFPTTLKIMKENGFGI